MLSPQIDTTTSFGRVQQAANHCLSFLSVLSISLFSNYQMEQKLNILTFAPSTLDFDQCSFLAIPGMLSTQIDTTISFGRVQQDSH